MKLLVSHLSALRYWRSANDLEVAASAPARIRTTRGCVNNLKDALLIEPRSHGLIMNEDYPLEILVDSREARRPSKCLLPRVWSGDLPYGAMSRIADGIYVSSPEFVFLQLANLLDIVELARLGNELCGTYNLRMGEHFTQRSEPLTTKARIAAFVSRAKGSHGVAKARKALQWVCDGSASPQETNVLLALCLPRRFGGYGLPLPQLNPEIEVAERLVAYVDGEVFRPDYLWERVRHGVRMRITAEYDSHEHHDTAGDAEATRIRRNSFKTMGILVTSINRSQLRDPEAFLRAARQIARDLGIWRPEPDMSEVLACGDLLGKLSGERVG